MTLRALHYASAFLCWIVLAIKLVDLARQPSNRGLRSLCSIILGLSVSLTVGLPRIYAFIDRLTAVPNIAKLIQYVSAMGACLAISVMYSYRHRPDAKARVWPRIGLGIGVSVGMTVLFILAPVDVSEPLYFADRYSTVAFVPQFMFLFVIVLAVIFADIAISSWRYRRQVATGYFRFGIRLISAAAVSGVVYAAFKGLYIIAQFFDVSPPVREGAIATSLALTTTLLGVAGITLPKVGKAIEAARHRLRCYRTYRRLYRLWSDLHAATPEIVLLRPGGFLDILDIEYRLYRRMIEISDGLLALRSTAPPNSALARALQGHEPPAGRSLEDEAKWLTQVADAYRPGAD